MDKDPLIYIIILVYNGKKWLDGCITSVMNSDYANYRLLVIDNASADGSFEYMRKRFPKVVTMKNKKNIGFGRGNNIGMEIALKDKADFVMLLNQDTKVEPSMLGELVEIAKSDKKIGIISPMQYDYSGRYLDRAFARNMGTSLEFQYDLEKGRKNLKKYYEIKNEIIGASMLLSKELLFKIGLFDPLYFCYGEDTDLCSRAVYHGYKLAIATGAKVFHWHELANSEEVDRNFSIVRLRGLFLFDFKNHRKTFLQNILGNIISFIRQLRKSGTFKEAKSVIMAELWVFSKTLIVFKKRCKEKIKPCYFSENMQTKKNYESRN